MDNEIFESILKITEKQDSDEFSLSIVATLAEIIPDSVVALFEYCQFTTPPYQCITSLSIEQQDSDKLRYLWDIKLPASSHQYIRDHYQALTHLTEYQTNDDRYHVFIPIDIEGKVVFGLEISSLRSFREKLEVLVAITKVCQNFYAILSYSERDSLTGLYNRRTYDNKLNSLLKNQQSSQLHHYHPELEQETRLLLPNSTTWLAIFDIDFFKKINDKFGHAYGDEVLLTLSQFMQQSFRNNDLLFRYGGEEFVLILEPVPFEQAVQVLNNFKTAVAQYKFPMVGHITISCGFAKISKKDHPKTVFDCADKALYYAKEHGRNSVYNYELLLEQGQIQHGIEEGDIELF
ncbi:GGDEF domain-containing protein [Thalassotalea insulae]|uniref:diguanylate cyclase n=1 Tax=Thalassotalea insulae TaxID=2056778 RepID=A0ABQ6GQD5_9GAMM|nr:GGDEF domain-containing protein [Thalassotalea insulae]GLX76910.1 GGDEF domain-containing protein [Thalassotalea insulae]